MRPGSLVPGPWGAVGEVLDETDLPLSGLIDAHDTRRPFYGSAEPHWVSSPRGAVTVPGRAGA